MLRKLSFLLFFFILATELFAQAIPYRIRMADSTYSAQLRGKSGTFTDGIIVNGSYSSTFKAHEFNVTVDGLYDLWFDPAGGTNFSKDTGWSGLNGKYIQTPYFNNMIDQNNNYYVDQIEDSIIELHHLTQDAIDYIGSAGSVTNYPDDVWLRTDPGNKITAHDTIRNAVNRVSGDTSLTGLDSVGVYDYLSKYEWIYGSLNYIQIGRDAGLNSTSRGGAVIIGYEAAKNAGTISGSIGIGYQALYNNNSTYNTAIGFHSMQNHTTGSYNVAIGYRTFGCTENSSANTAVGSLALFSNRSNVHSNTAIGHGALYSSGSSENTAVGVNSLYYLQEGQYNTAIGVNSAMNLLSGYYNIAIGHSAMYSFDAGYSNVAVGSNALSMMDTGQYNTAIGSSTGGNYNPGDYNVYIGTNAVPADNGNSNEIVIGAKAVGNGSNSVTLGDTNITKTILRPNVGIGVTTPSKAVEVNGGIKADTVFFTGNNAVVDPVRMVYSQSSLSINGSNDAPALNDTILILDWSVTLIRFNFMRFPGEDTLFFDFEGTSDMGLKYYTISVYYYGTSSTDSTFLYSSGTRESQTGTSNFAREEVEKIPIASLNYFKHYQIIIRYTGDSYENHYMRRFLVYVR